MYVQTTSGLLPGAWAPENEGLRSGGLAAGFRVQGVDV